MLDEAGNQATISDESLVAMDWLLSNAVGGVKVQVWEEDADRAVGVLEQKLGAQGEGLGETVSPEELAAEAAAATPDEGEEPQPTPAGEVPVSLETEAPSERDGPHLPRFSKCLCYPSEAITHCLASPARCSCSTSST